MAGGSRYRFDAFELDSQARVLTRDEAAVPLSDRHFDVLLQLVSNPGAVLSKDALVEGAWRDVAVTDNSLEQAVSALRRTLGATYIETVPRRGYRFTGQVTRTTPRQSDAALDALLAPHRAWLEGRAALETLERDEIVRAREAFERVLQTAPDQPVGHIGLANACALQFEMTRADRIPDNNALTRAAEHAREACRLDPQSAEAWATLGFVLDRSGLPADAAAATKRAVTLEPDNWRLYFRHALVTWGEERLRAARKMLALCPGFPLAHWLAATVLIARQLQAEAERELLAGADGAAGPAAEASTPKQHTPFSGVALHWLLGLVYLDRGDDERAMAEFERELSFEHHGHLYARECCANTWYAIGAVHLRRADHDAARRAFEETLRRVESHPFARVALGLEPHAGSAAPARMIDAAIVEAVRLSLSGARADAARVVDRALAAAPPGGAGWLLPVEPMLHVSEDPSMWAPALSRLRTRAA